MSRHSPAVSGLSLIGCSMPSILMFTGAPVDRNMSEASFSAISLK